MIKFILQNPLVVVFSVCISFPLAFIVSWKNKEESGDWGGKLQTRFNWRRFKFEKGRFHYKTNAFGETLDCWWKKES